MHTIRESRYSGSSGTGRNSSLAWMLAFVLLFAASGNADAKSGIVNTRHNLSVTGPGELRALTETRICVFCHTPHNALPATPLWNKKIEAINYNLYSSTTMAARPSQPDGPSRLCLSCHDGTIALGAVLRPAEGISMTTGGGIPASRRSYLGTSLSDDHPVSFSYYDSLPNPELSPSPPQGLLFYGSSLHCSTCHDAHDNTYKKFLAADNINSGLCTRCHIENGWIGSVHAGSPAVWNGILPDPWPRTGSSSDFGFVTVAANGCENCHAPHNAGGPNRLLNAAEEEQTCYPCHNGNVASRNVQAEFQKASHHPVELTAIGITPNHHEPNESPTLLAGHVECADCHNSHAANERTANAPALSGKMDRVSGVTLGGSGIVPPLFAVYEYEVCFKCHADSSSRYPVIARVVSTVNTRLQFNPANPSYHPVTATGRNNDVPSIPSTYQPDLTASSIIYCTDCHDSDDSVSLGGSGPRGAHGSIYSPILRQRYEMNDNTPESPANYALCYQCHNRSSILSDISFQKNSTGKGGHSGHLGSPVNTPCSACHEPHGVKDNGLSGSHTHLINFDSTIVQPLASSGYSVPVFNDNGTRSGNCTLVCHGVSHDGFNGASLYRY